MLLSLSMGWVDQHFFIKHRIQWILFIPTYPNQNPSRRRRGWRLEEGEECFVKEDEEDWTWLEPYSKKKTMEIEEGEEDYVRENEIDWTW